MTTTLPATGTRSGYGAVLRVRGLRAVYLAHGVSVVGTVASGIALSILVYERSGSALLSALVLSCSFVPYAFGGAALSALADRFPARRVLVACDSISAACMAAMLVPGMPVGGMLGLLLVIGTVAPVFQGARSASLAQLLGPDLFPAGRSLLRVISQGAVLGGFAGGSVIVAAIGSRWMIAADAVSFCASAAVIRFGTPATPPTAKATVAATATPRAVLRDSLGGLRYVISAPPLRRLMALSWALPAFAAAVDGVIVAYAAQVGGSASAAGALFTGYAAGIVVGEVALGRVRPSVRQRMVLPLLAVNQVPMLVFAASPAVPLASAMLVVAGTGWAVNQPVDRRVLAVTDPGRIGQVFTVQSSGMMAMQGIGIAVAGTLATVWPAAAVVVVCGAVGVVVLTVLAVRAGCAARE